MTEPYTFLGHPVPADIAARIADRIVLRDERDGALIVRMRTEQLAVLIKGTRVRMGRAA